ncbi:MAG: copper oxidase, partial [Halobacteriovoraceae bacterium]|nr:copper oxidase [Halobacteriovoraceae bacterium]
MSDWTNEKPLQVLANLKKDGDYYKYKKDFLPSILGAIRHGAIWDYLKGEWTRMGPMDLSDVGYDAFLINGKINSMLKNVKHGEKIRFRIINASASTYFYFNIGNLRNFTVVSKDGVDVQPVKVNELLIGIAETYDVIFEMPHHMKMFEAKATAQDITGSASLMFGKGEMEHVPNKMKPSPYGMGDMDHG